MQQLQPQRPLFFPQGFGVRITQSRGASDLHLANRQPSGSFTPDGCRFAVGRL
jgi:hypothetical protein